MWMNNCCSATLPVGRNTELEWLEVVGLEERLEWIGETCLVENGFLGVLVLHDVVANGLNVIIATLPHQIWQVSDNFWI